MASSFCHGHSKKDLEERIMEHDKGYAEHLYKKYNQTGIDRAFNIAGLKGNPTIITMLACKVFGDMNYETIELCVEQALYGAIVGKHVTLCQYLLVDREPSLPALNLSIRMGILSIVCLLFSEERYTYRYSRGLVAACFYNRIRIVEYFIKVHEYSKKELLDIVNNASYSPEIRSLVRNHLDARFTHKVINKAIKRNKLRQALLF